MNVEGKLFPDPLPNRQDVKVKKLQLHYAGMPMLASRKIKRIYIGGSMKNERVNDLAKQLRSVGIEVFDDWICSGPDADDHWKEYEEDRGRTYIEALQGAHAKNVVEFDKFNIDRSDAFVMVLPCGRSAHIELGYCVGVGKPSYIVLTSDHDRWDVMYAMATKVFQTADDFSAFMIEQNNGC